ncbi:helix-turn-helix domain-containing protein [Clostridium cellulovorans]|uniref:Helix-turn-helix domain protein n=1 Tax=Clostridium cellulovorans (strain ATCC 35296 / DSM 3052 / OCM 3 / 743B) TaxID=573061 RepID=D9SQ33_CLOC7|nr:helix-turn-helix transcriptional regulator [Clostridium cellulovorans]ADL52169.1 helix-turn-helix domain protein [Clostridium cellulovorans 743B]
MNENELKQIIERIKNRRIELGLSYQDMQDATGISKSTWQRYETGFIKNLGIDKLDIVAKILQTTPSYLMGWDTDKKAEIDTSGIHTIAAHFEGEDFTEADKEDIENFIKFVLSKKDKKK